jgi:limonene-1,2-epoxide hydrolase
MTPKQTIEAVFAAFGALDLEAVYALVDGDVVYQNMAQGPVHGLQGLRDLWAGFGAISHLHSEVIHILAEGEVVLAERLEHMVIDGREIAVPMAGAFRVRDGKITEWREYYDMATFERQLGVTHPGAGL